MGSITIVENVSLDGVVQAPGSPDEDTRDGVAHGGWVGPYPDAVLGGGVGRRRGVAGPVARGRAGAPGAPPPGRGGAGGGSAAYPGAGLGEVMGRGMAGEGAMLF